MWPDYFCLFLTYSPVCLDVDAFALVQGIKDGHDAVKQAVDQVIYPTKEALLVD